MSFERLSVANKRSNEQTSKMRESGGEATDSGPGTGDIGNNFGPNLSSTLAANLPSEQLSNTNSEDSNLNFLRMTLCSPKTIISPQSSSTIAFISQLVKETLKGTIPTAAATTTTTLPLTTHHLLTTNHDHYYSTTTTNDPSDNQTLVQPLTKLTLNYIIKPMQDFDTTLDYYFSEFWKNGDQRSSKLPFMSGGPWKLIYATLIYLYLIKWLLPKLMSRFKALELNWCIRVYNLLMVVSNMFAFYHGIRILELGTKCFGCEIINHDDYSPKAIELLHYGWLFFMSRLVEWLDTIFFVLRKKEKQVTKLHVFHHSFVPMICWTYLKFHPGYTVAFFPLVNTFVHTIMYTYYLLATFGSKIQPYLWWKKYLTSLQIAQFVLILIQLASIPLSSNEKCQYPRGFLYVAFGGAILFLWLFYTYYIETYKTTTTKCDKRFQRTNDVRSNNNLSPSMGYSRLLNFKEKLREGQSNSLSETIENAIDQSPLPLVKNITNLRQQKFAVKKLD